MTEFKKACINAAIGHLEEIMYGDANGGISNEDILSELRQCQHIITGLIDNEEMVLKLKDTNE